LFFFSYLKLLSQWLQFAFVDVNSLASNYMCIRGDGARGGGATIICIDEL